MLPLCLYWLLCQLHPVASQKVNNYTVRIANEYTYLLPNGFEGNLNYTFANGTETPGNSSVQSLLQSASEVPFIAFDDEFLEMIGTDPHVKLVDQRDNYFAYEAGVWVSHSRKT